MKEFFEIIALVFETAAVVVLVIGSIMSGGRYARQMLISAERHKAYRKLRVGFGRTLLVALDLLLTADIILTVTLEFSFDSLAMLGMLVVIRTFLHVFIEVEVTGHWPWQGWRASAGERPD